MAAEAYNPSTLELEAGELVVQEHLQLYSKLKAQYNGLLFYVDNPICSVSFEYPR